MHSSVKRYGPPLVSILVCWVYVGVLYRGVVTQLNGFFVYPLEDTYIHMALARNLALHHVWGIHALQFASASSSPGWTLLLAAMDILVGPHLLTPLLLNVVFAGGVVLAADYGLRLFVPEISDGLRVIGLLTIVLLTPLPSLVLLGMEHVAQVFTVVLLVVAGCDILATSPEIPVGRSKQVLVLTAAFLAGCIRYEAVFAIIPLCGLLLWRRRVALAILVGALAAAMPLGFGLYSHHLSGFWLPFSVVAKQALPHHTGLGRIVHLPFKWVVAVMLPLWLLNLRSLDFWQRVQLLTSFSFVIVLLHLLFAPVVGGMMRYESYLIALCLLTIEVTAYRIHYGESWGHWLRCRSRVDRGLVFVLIGFFVVFAGQVVRRGWVFGTIGVQRASVDRYTEHIQTARFVASYYPDDTIVVNDIGAIAYYTHAHMLDIVGLGSVEPVAEIKSGHPMSANDIARWSSSQHAAIAIVQGSGVFARMIPPVWIHVWSWLIPRNVAYGDRTIDFYAIDGTEVPRLCDALRAFPLVPQDQEIPVKNICPAVP